MKKKILSMCLVVALLAIAIVGGTLAYFTDTDAQKNTFTTGNVAIDLWEDFGDNDSEGIEKLLPATGSAQDGSIKNYVTKKVYVTNTGSEAAYVRVHIAIPSILDDAQPTFDASKNVLHFNWLSGTQVDGKWNWTDSVDTNTGASNWNFYKTTIDGKNYNVYVVTYETALAKDGETESAIHQVYLDSKTTNEDITKINAELGEKWYIYVAAEGAQAEGFANAYEALNTAFGNPTDSAYTSQIDWTTVAGETWANND